MTDDAQRERILEMARVTVTSLRNSPDHVGTVAAGIIAALAELGTGGADARSYEDGWAAAMRRALEFCEVAENAALKSANRLTVATYAHNTALAIANSMSAVGSKLEWLAANPEPSETLVATPPSAAPARTYECGKADGLREAAKRVRERFRYSGTRATDVASMLADGLEGDAENLDVCAELGVDVREFAAKMRAKVSEHFALESVVATPPAAEPAPEDGEARRLLAELVEALHCAEPAAGAAALGAAMRYLAATPVAAPAPVEPRKRLPGESLFGDMFGDHWNPAAPAAAAQPDRTAADERADVVAWLREIAGNENSLNHDAAIVFHDVFASGSHVGAAARERERARKGG